MKRKIVVSLFSILLISVLATACSSDNAPTAQELVNNAAKTNPYRTMNFSGDFSGSIDLNAKQGQQTEIDTDGQKATSLSFTGSTPTNITNSENPSATLNVNNGGFIFSSDASTAYLTINGFTPLKINADQATDAASGITGTPVPDAGDLSQYQGLLSALQNTFADSATVSKGDDVAGQKTWNMDIDLGKVDYRQALIEYSDIFVKSFQQGFGATPGLKKELDKGIAGISDQDFSTVQGLLSKMKISASFYKESGMVASYSVSADWDKADFDKIVSLFEENSNITITDSSKIEFALDYQITYSYDQFKVDVPEKYINAESKAGQKEVEKITQQFLPDLANLFSGQSSSQGCTQQNPENCVQAGPALR
jgi:hypothetical protein